MKELNNTQIGLRRDRRARGVTVRPDGTEVIFNGCSKVHHDAPYRNAAMREAVREDSIVATTSNAAASSAANRIRNHQWRRLTRKQARRFNIAVLLICMLGFGGAVAWSSSPCAITIDDEPVCYVSSTDNAVKTMKLLAEDNIPNGSAVKAISVGKNLGTRKVIGFDKRIRTPEEAMQYVRDKYLHKNKAEMITASTKVTFEKFNPSPDLRKDDDMLAGQERIESESISGEQKVTTQYSVRNGQMTGEDVVDVEVIDKGTPAVIYRGTLGLPEGEDWRTYEGMPVYNDGEDLITDAKHYLGLRYIWGGFNLNKGVDCVGFVVEMYKKFGIKLPHSHAGLRKSGIEVPSIKEAKAGDIICYNGHVALYMGNGKIIHATRGKSNNVHISNKVNYNKKRHIITIRRIVN